MLGAVCDALLRGETAPQCPEAQEDWLGSEKLTFTYGVLVGLLLLPVSELVVIVRRVWASGLASTTVNVERPVHLPALRH